MIKSEAKIKLLANNSKVTVEQLLQVVAQIEAAVVVSMCFISLFFASFFIFFVVYFVEDSNWYLGLGIASFISWLFFVVAASLYRKESLKMNLKIQHHRKLIESADWFLNNNMTSDQELAILRQYLRKFSVT